MKQKYLISLAILFSVFAFYFIYHQSLVKNPDQPKLAPGEWLAHQRMFPFNEIKPDVYKTEMKKAHQLNKQSSLNKEFEWEFVGPTNIGGRITDIEMPENQSDVIYIGAATGGVLKTDDSGESWMQLFHDIPTISVGDIAIDPQNSNVLYVGTGEANSSSFSFLGSGVYKSTDAGQTWSFSGLANSAYIGRMIVDHTNSSRVYAAASGLLFSPNEDRGIYRSDDGGENWEQVLFVSDTTAAIDLVQHPLDPDILYAGFWERTRGLTTRRSFGQTTGIYKTTDGGDTWEELTNGLPDPLMEKGRPGITISKSNPNVLYVMYDMPDQETWVFKTEDGGDNWTQVDNGYLYSMGSTFGWYFGQIRVHPEDENVVFALGQYMYRTTNSGNSWVNIDNSGVHVDHHAMFFDLNSGKTYLGNDGGLYWTTNFGNSWNKINNLPITQFYAYDVSETNQDFQVGGTQDNNSIRTIGGDTEDWEAVLGGDGMYNRINQQDNDIAWAEYQYGNLYRSFNAQDNYPNYNYVGWQMESDRKNWSAPLELVPDQNQIAYFGSYRVWKTIDNGNNWTSVSGDLTQGGSNYFHSIACLAVSTINTDYVLAGSADGMVHISLDAGDSWSNISSGLPERWITDVYFDPQEENTIYATISGFRWDEALPHIYKSTDLGVTWESISGNLPEIPINQMEIDPDDSENIIIGTDAGIYMTTNGGDLWKSISGNLPMVPVVSFKLIPQTKDLYAATYGLSTWKINLNDVNVGIETDISSFNDFDVQLIKGDEKYILINNTIPQNINIRVYNLKGQLVDERSEKFDVGKFNFSIKEYSANSGVLVYEFSGSYSKKVLKVN